MSARRACPYCGWRYSDRKPVGGYRSVNRGSWFVECCACKARGPAGTSKPDADRLWDGRNGPGVQEVDGNVVVVSFGGRPPRTTSK